MKKTHFFSAFSKRRKFAALFLLTFLVVLQGCFSVKPQASQAGNPLYESFFLEGGVMQYFIKPLEFEGKNEELQLDVTLRDTKAAKSEATLNFSIFSENDLALADSMAIEFHAKRVAAGSISKLFFEKTHYRYTSSFETESVLDAFLAGKFNILLYFKGNAMTFSPTNNTQDSIGELNSAILKHFYLSQ